MRNDICSEFNKGAKDYRIGTISNKIVLTSKSRSETKVHQRKPIKECYCISEDSNRNKGTDETIKKTLLSKNCWNNDTELVELYSSANTDTAKNSMVASLLGYETLRKARRITYLPNSEFLRRIQNKVYSHRRKKPATVCSEFSSNSSSLDSWKSLADNSGKNESAMKISCHEKNAKREGKIESRSNYELKHAEDENRGRRRIFVPSKSSRSHSLCLENRGIAKTRGNENIQRGNESKIRPKVGSKKIARSVNCVGDERSKSQRVVRTISAHSRCCCPQKFVEKSKIFNKENIKSQPVIKANDSDANCECEIKRYPTINRENTWHLSRDRIYSRTRDNEDRVKELSKFRRANYFETHGSVNTLVGTSRSSMTTIQQCDLNDRIFVTPRYPAKQIKRIHYYPSYVVREERLMDDKSCRKKIRSRSYDFTEHIVDLGILKIPCNFSNDLAFTCHRGGGDDE